MLSVAPSMALAFAPSGAVGGARVGVQMSLEPLAKELNPVVGFWDPSLTPPLTCSCVMIPCGGSAPAVLLMYTRLFLEFVAGSVAACCCYACSQMLLSPYRCCTHILEAVLLPSCGYYALVTVLLLQMLQCGIVTVAAAVLHLTVATVALVLHRLLHRPLILLQSDCNDCNAFFISLIDSHLFFIDFL